MLGASENALLEALQSHRDVKRLVRTVGTLPKLPLKEQLQKYAVDAPAIYVIPGRFVVKDSQALMRFTLAAVVRNAAGQEQARKGDGVDLGCDHLMILVIRALNGQRLGNCTWWLASGEMADDEIFDTAGIAALELQFEGTPIDLPEDFGEAELAALAAQGANTAGMDDFQHLHADFDIAPQAGEAEHNNWLQSPPDLSTAQPDLTLDVQLPGANS
jgi:hypothetical protein